MCMCVTVYAIFRHNEEVYYFCLLPECIMWSSIATIAECWTSGEACSNATTLASHTLISAHDKTLINVLKNLFV